MEQVSERQLPSQQKFIRMKHHSITCIKKPAQGSLIRLCNPTSGHFSIKTISGKQRNQIIRLVIEPALIAILLPPSGSLKIGLAPQLPSFSISQLGTIPEDSVPPQLHAPTVGADLLTRLHNGLSSVSSYIITLRQESQADTVLIQSKNSQLN